MAHESDMEKHEALVARWPPPKKPEPRPGLATYTATTVMTVRAQSAEAACNDVRDELEYAAKHSTFFPAFRVDKAERAGHPFREDDDGV